MCVFYFARYVAYRAPSAAHVLNAASNAQRLSRGAHTSAVSIADAERVQKNGAASIAAPQSQVAILLRRLAQRDDLRLQLRFLAHPLDGLRHRNFYVCLVANVVAVENAASLVAGDEHRNAVRES